MTPLDPEGARSGGALLAGTKVGAVHLTVADIERSLEYYQAAIGLELRWRDGQRASLGVGELELVVLVGETGARVVPGHTGLYHFALLLPERADLARWLAHAMRDHVPLSGLSDHFVSEALYLRDPDGHGIEIYWDRPRELWDGQVATRMTTAPLDVDSLLGEVDEPLQELFMGMADGTVMGHVHLKVAALPEAVAFYRDALGLGLMAQLGSQAAFLSAGGYHHHVGINTWESAGAGPAPDGSASLRHATIVLLDPPQRDLALDRLAAAGVRIEEGEGTPLVKDPSGNAWALAVVTEQPGAH